MRVVGNYNIVKISWSQNVVCIKYLQTITSGHSKSELLVLSGGCLK